jgi:hypothetical protein
MAILTHSLLVAAHSTHATNADLNIKYYAWSLLVNAIQSAEILKISPEIDKWFCPDKPN